ncbi:MULTISPECIES: prolipoprotein diacylglyceryl transferase [Desulfitobacterium]|uniref:Phosphatidylglycerol--prolipoprotein diacylglyceryl transferase n=1 Tax=Desulfitobacterium dehalogenans (strain ATCC 51507 / DSM 9161 / JW/IU-DC1) TaxID=756499 RepID=I4A7S0_DESDJ|nr:MULTISPECIES: prolipoprotein diacylglyceryl transferase [Desulfitobacterium]AFM00005.1 prolipoprotein diacylglyceryl transferase [Desulfitobacterium dehalogenans ATCC 51507]
MAPILFTMGNFSLRSYGVIVVFAILFGLAVAYLLTSDKDYRDYLFDVLIYGIIGAIIGARSWQVFFYEWDYYSQNLAEIPMIWHGGLAIQGALAGAFFAAVIYAKVKKINFWRLADSAAPGLILGQAIGRIACFLNGDAYGTPTGSNFGIVYPEGTPAYAAYGSQPLWPAEVWEGQWDVIVFVILLILTRWRKWPQGIIFLAYIILYSIGRFALEFLRGDSPYHWLNWTSGQWTSVGMMIISLGAVLFLRNKCHA